MKVLVLTLCSLALVAADVSHLLGHEHHHDEHAGYNYEPPNVSFDLPKPKYLPPVEEVASLPIEPAAPQPKYLPPVAPPAPQPKYLPPVAAPAPPTPKYLPPVSAPSAPAAPAAPAAPKAKYLPPAAPAVKVDAPKPEYLPPSTKTDFKIPIPSYAAPLQPGSTYLPPQEAIEAHSDDGYHYNAPARTFRF